MHTAKIFSLMFGLALAAAACGDSKSSLNPTAPSAVSADAISVEADADAVSGSMAKGPKPGNGNGNGNGNSGGGNGNGNGGGGNGNGGGGNGNGNGNCNDPRTPTNTSPTAPTAPVPPGKSKVEFEGLLQAVGGGSITVNGQVITVTSETVIRHGNRTFELSDLHVGDRVHVRANRVAPPAGGTTTLVETTLQAAVILVQNPGDATDPGEGEDDGLVSVSAFDASAIEGVAGNNGVFRLTRTGTLAQLASSLTVTFTLSGTAASGVDYATVPLTATFGANQASVDVTIEPLVDNTVEGPETVILTLTNVAPFELGSPVAATLAITDSANPLVSVLAADATANESGDTGRFMLVRTGNLSSQLTVTIALTGAAVNGTDYDTVEATVTFQANAPSASVFIVPVADSVSDPTETVILSVVDGASYDLGTSPSATVTISGS